MNVFSFFKRLFGRKGKIKVRENTPYVSTNIGTKKFLLILDTGAEVSCMSKAVQPLFPNIQPKGIDKLQSCHGQESVVIYEVPLIINEWLYFTDVVFTNSEVFESMEIDGLKVVGVLGCDFLIKYKAIIDFRQKNIYS